MSYFGKLHLRRDYFGGHQSRQLSICHTVSFGRCRGEKCDDSIEQAHQKENTMKKFFTGMLVLALLASLIGCSAETITSADASASNLIYVNTISPNEKYIAQESDKVFYTIQVYQEENGVKVASSSNSAFSQAPGKFFKKFFQWLNLISFLSVGTTTKKRRFYHRISASITILVFLRGEGNQVSVLFVFSYG